MARKFHYRAYTATGQLEQGTIAALDQAAARDALSESGKQVIALRAPRGLAGAMVAQVPTLYRPKNSELIMFSRLLATFVRSGVPIAEAIKLIQEQSSSRGLRYALEDVVDDLQSGDSLSLAMSRQPMVFDHLYVDMIRAAEVSGLLDQVLIHIATYLQRQEGAMRKLRSAMIYPTVILTLAIVVCVIMVVFVLPNFVQLFAEFHADLPPTTRILIAVGDFAGRYKILILAAIGFVVVAVGGFLTTHAGKYARDNVLTRLPVLGTIVTYSVIERFARTLSTMLSAGIPIGQTFEVATAATGNLRFQSALGGVAERMLTGEGFYGPLEATRLFPRMVLRMIRVGEETGTLDAQLEEVARFYDEEIELRVKAMIALIEPAMVIFVGALVGFVAVSVISPMYGLLHSIH
ncbi:MAG: type II secretion system F family protein [Candidatus Dormibacteria bacterium]